MSTARAPPPPPSAAHPCLPLPGSPLSAVPPRIRPSGAPQELSVLEGQEARLDCEADGQPPPDVAWLKDGRPLGEDSGAPPR